MQSSTANTRPSAGASLLVLGMGGLLGGSVAWANPQGPSVVAGSATIVPHGPTLSITVSDRAVLNWQSFNIAPGETTRFLQPNAASIVWNQVLSPNPSQIFGSIQANGIVVLANQAGFWFGPNSVVKAASFVATTASGPPPNFEAGGAWNLSFAPPLASIINYGNLETEKGGSIFLVAEKIDNHGVLMAPDGNIGLYAGKELLVSERPDGRGLSAKLSLPSGSVDNHGKLIADAGTIAMQAQVVNQGGLVQANSISDRNGVIELLASESVTLGAGSQTLAEGDKTGISSGGTITIKSDAQYKDAPTATVSAAGGRQGGNGGQVEISSENLPVIRAQVDGSASKGYTAGQMLIDPNSIVISAAGDTSAGSGTVNAGDGPSGTLTISPSAFANFSQITLQAKTTLAVNTLWSLPDTLTGGAKLTLQAGTDLTFGNGGGIAAGAGWSVELDAGMNFTTGRVTPGVGSVLVNSAGVQASDGNILISAGKDVTVTTGFVHTIGGGGITVNALAGNINSGNGAGGFTFISGGTGYFVNPTTLGGISTGAGGDVNLTAGKDVTSFLPTLSNGLQDAGSGAFGPEPGNVKVTAGGNVYGHYVLMKGTGDITAGASAGTASRQLALSLADGSWNVAAADIALQEVRNPNGTFNRIGGKSTSTFHLYDYDPAASVSLTASDGVQLLGAALPRNANESGVPVMYPPSLEISAGAGGVTLGGNLTLFPSPIGQLAISTTDSGSLQGLNPAQSYQLTMADSASRQFTFAAGQFGAGDHGPTLLHAGDLQPVVLNIAGDVSGLRLSVPKPAEILVGGDFVNTSLQVQNLRPTDQTLLAVTGDIRNASDYTFVTLPDGAAAPDFNLLPLADPPVGANLGYDPTTRTVSLRGRLSDSDRNILLNFQVEVTNPNLDPQGTPLLDPITGLPLTEPYSLLPASVVNALYAGSQAVPISQSMGYQVAGPGKFMVKARSIDLGVSAGIVTAGAEANPALAAISGKGAGISVQTTGDIVMYSSAIISKAGGDISVVSGGNIEVGGTFVVPDSGTARGIYSSAGSDVTVVATKDIALNGSRIATYDGGNLTVKSLTGSVDAGTGGLSLQNVEQVRVDPASGTVSVFSDYIPGSGILATTFSYGSAQAGNISINTPRGDILARSGGVVQASFNGTSTANSSVTLTAGTPAVGKPGDANYVAAVNGKIDASKSGVIGGNVTLDATGDIIGLVFASGNATLNTPQNVSATVLAQGTASVSSGGSVSGTIVGIGSASVSGASIEASVLSVNATTTGATSGQVGFAAANVAGSTAQAASASTSEKKESVVVKSDSDDDEKRRKASKPLLARTIGRVTVILPNQTKAN